MDEKAALLADFTKQIKEFKEDNSYEEEYRRFSPRKDKVLVKVFRFTPSDKAFDLGSSPILTISPIDGVLKPSKVSKNEKLFPIVKIIKKGKEASADLEEGKLYVVPYNDIVGDTWNPDFQWMMQNFSQKRGDGKPGLVTIPDDMPQRLNKIDVHWERYKFSMPDRIGDEQSADKLVYLIPELKLEADYEI